jgi:hypothetical protein
MSFFPWAGDVAWDRAIERMGFVCDFIVFSPLAMLKSGVLAHVILTCHCLKSQINLGIRMQEVDKDLGRKTASETLVGRLDNYISDRI